MGIKADDTENFCGKILPSAKWLRSPAPFSKLMQVVVKRIPLNFPLLDQDF